MERLAPLGDVYQAGTLSGNPLAMAAGLATLELLREPGAYERLEQTSAALAAGLAAPGVTVNRLGAMLTAFFTDGPVHRLPLGRYQPTASATPASTRTCSSAASTSRRPSSRR